VSGLTNALQVFRTCSLRLHSRILQFWSSSRTQCIFQLIWTCVSCLLLRGLSKGRIHWHYSHLIVNLVVYLCPKFGGLNPRINEIRSGKVDSCTENWLQPLPEEETSRFSIPMIFGLSDLVAVFAKASGTIMDSSLYVSSYLYSSHLYGS
jgi:hypothetical protein